MPYLSKRDVLAAANRRFIIRQAAQIRPQGEGTLKRPGEATVGSARREQPASVVVPPYRGVSCDLAFAQ